MQDLAFKPSLEIVALEENIREIRCNFDLSDVPIVQWRVRVNAYVQKDQSLGVLSFPNSGRKVQIVSPANGCLLKQLVVSGRLDEEIISKKSEVGDSSKYEPAKVSVALCILKEQNCEHQILVENLCVDCGTVVSETQTAESHSDLSAYTSTLGFVASGRNFHTTYKFAQQLEVEKIEELLKSKKLPLVLDLDNTLLHAYPVPPPEDTCEFFKEKHIDFRVCSLSEPNLYVQLEKQDALRYKQGNVINVWERYDSHDDSNNVTYYTYPHYLDDYHESVIQNWENWAIESIPDDLAHCQLVDSSSYSYRCYYKLRPKVIQFLRSASALFELYLFTAGTLTHATSSLQVLDPSRLWFGDRVFTREDLPQLTSGSLGLKTIQRIFPGEVTRHNLVTIVDDCDTVWARDSNIFKVHAYHWWPEPTLHPFLLLYCRRTLNSPGSHSMVPVGVVDVNSYTRARAISNALLNFLPSVIELCRSPRIIIKYSDTQDTKQNEHCHLPMNPFNTPLNNVPESSQSQEDGSLRDTDNASAKRPKNHTTIAQLTLLDTDIPYDEYTPLVACTESELQQSDKITSESCNEAGAVNSSQISEPRERLIATTSTENYSQEQGEVPTTYKQLYDRNDMKFGLPEGNESINETNSRVLFTATEGWTPPELLRDTDCQLPYLFEALKAMHTRFFFEFENRHFFTEDGHIDVTQLPNVKTILDSMRKEILKGVVCKTTGIREASIPDLRYTDLGRAVIDLGGEIISQSSVRKNASHLLVGKETEYFSEAKAKKLFEYHPHLMWIEAALFTFRRPDETLFQPEKCERVYRVFWDALDGIPVTPLESNIETTASPTLDEIEELMFS